MLTFHPALNATIAIASNMENDDQTHPSEALCLLTSVRSGIGVGADICTATGMGIGIGIAMGFGSDFGIGIGFRL